MEKSRAKKFKLTDRRVLHLRVDFIVRERDVAARAGPKSSWVRSGMCARAPANLRTHRVRCGSHLALHRVLTPAQTRNRRAAYTHRPRAEISWVPKRHIPIIGLCVWHACPTSVHPIGCHVVKGFDARLHQVRDFLLMYSVPPPLWCPPHGLHTTYQLQAERVRQKLPLSLNSTRICS